MTSWSAWASDVLPDDFGAAADDFGGLGAGVEAALPANGQGADAQPTKKRRHAMHTNPKRKRRPRAAERRKIIARGVSPWTRLSPLWGLRNVVWPESRGLRPWLLAFAPPGLIRRSFSRSPMFFADHTKDTHTIGGEF